MLRASSAYKFLYERPNAVNNITQMIDGAGAHNYTYDIRDRLTGATHPNQANESYTLDEVGPH